MNHTQNDVTNEQFVKIAELWLNYGARVEEIAQKVGIEDILLVAKVIDRLCVVRDMLNTELNKKLLDILTGQIERGNNVNT